MEKKTLHPTVQEFREFVKSNPKIMEEVRNGNSTLQELFEEWYLLGGEDSRWDAYRSVQNVAKSDEDKKEDWLSNVLSSLKKMDANMVQSYMQNLNQALGAMQGVVSQFQTGNSGNGNNTNNKAPQRPNPFAFRKD